MLLQIMLVAIFLTCLYFLFRALISAAWFEKLAKRQSKRFNHNSEDYLYMNDDENNRDRN
ncbi:hypothetical protein EHV15_13075 [Paenibacillus oralis]|uniref:Uncharacterized protein n=1 Tax=Paenibacillus oralis TaxID=2490856 RepID=A0A3P3U075_9BACL|nr:hypothetical protein [Paenibacillus oralis]RRJ63757.1 hypothetical protein EHV15_13075 [Paenibacillus oralis]